MVIKWEKSAENDLYHYRINSKRETSIVIKYISDLINYTNELINYPDLGKDFIIINDIQIKELIFEKMHRIFYYIDNEKIRIIMVTHTSRNLDNVISIIKYLI